MKKRQSKSSLIKGIVATCLLFNHLSGYVPIVKAFSSNNLDEGVQSEVETNDFYSVLEDNQFVTTPNETSPIVEEGDIELETDESLLEVESGDLTNEENLSNEEKDQLDQLPLETQQELSILTDEELIIEDSNVMAQEEIEVSTGSESRSVGAGLVQLWQVVPSGQTQEGKTTSEIMKALQCRPNHNLYPLNGSTQHQTYVNSCYVDDALYLGEDDTYYHIYLSGYEGKVPKSETHTFSLDLNGDGKYVDYQIQTVAYYIPGSTVKAISNDEVIHPDAPELNYYDQHLNKYSEAEARSIDFYSTATVQSPSYYANDNGTLVHYVTNNVKVANNYSKVTVGKAPSWMSSGVKYYSYDGIYFYTNWQNIRVNGQGAVNQNNPFYNYYQYLPFRSKTNYSANAIDSYTNNNGGTGGKLVNTGQYFYAVQDNYGINGALQYAMGIHESEWGKSSLSIDKNNLFGMNATDNNPYGNGTSFPTVEAGINYHADRYLSWGYTDPLDDWRYFGSHVGNKGSGMNVKYASDPFWGEKIAGWYYRFDSTNGLKDYNYYTIGIKQSNVILDVKSAASGTSKTLYQTKNKKSNLKIINYPVLITGQEGNYYKIKSDTPIINQTATYNAQYKWNDTNAYIQKSNIYLSNAITNHSPSPDHSNTEYIGRLDNVQWNGSTLKVEGYGELAGYPTPTANEVKHLLVLVSNKTNKEYQFTLTPTYSSWLAADPHNLGGNYGYSWYSGEVDLSKLPLDTYTMYHEVTVSGHTQREPMIYYSSLPTTHTVDRSDYSFELYNSNHIQLVKSGRAEYIGRTDNLKWSGTQLKIEGYGELKGYPMATENSVQHKLILVNVNDSNKQYSYSLTPTYSSWLASDAHNLGGNYGYGWYTGSINLSNLPNGTYIMYHEMTVSDYTQRELLNHFDNVPSELYIGNDNLSFERYQTDYLQLTKKKETQYVGRTDKVYWSGTKLKIEGYGELKGYPMATENSVQHKLIFVGADNKEYKYTMTPQYNSWLAGDPHNLGGNYGYGWYSGSIDTSKLPNGTYTMYHEMTVSGYTQRKLIQHFNNLPSSSVVQNSNLSFNRYKTDNLQLVKQDKVNYLGRTDKLQWANDKLTIEGYGELQGYTMTSADSVQHKIVLVGINNPTNEYQYVMKPTYNSWLANDPHQFGGNYGYGWYTGTIDISKLPNDTYTMYHEMTVSGYTQREILQHYSGLTIGRTVGTSTVLFNRLNTENLQLVKKSAVSYLGRTDKVQWNGNKLSIEGYGELKSYPMTSSNSVKHQILFIDMSDASKTYSYSMTPQYSSWLANDPHQFGGNYGYGWYSGTIDVSKLPKGTYAIYHQMTVSGYTQRELIQHYSTIPSGRSNLSFSRYNSENLQMIVK